MKKLSKIQESVWANLHSRGIGETIREEEGQKVHTCLGVDIVLQDPQCGYDIFIKDMVKYNSSYCEGISKQAEVGFSTDELVNIRKWEAPYDYLVYDAPYGESLIISFTTYADILEYDEMFEEEISEKDYISICRGVAEKFKELGDSLEYVPNRNSCVAFPNSSKRQYAHEYDRNYVLMLVDESTTSYWSADKDREEYVDEFLEEISNEFPELEDEDFILWSYQYGVNIGLPHNLNTLNNFKKYKEFTQKWFSDEDSAKDKVEESVWADLHSRGIGELERDEEKIRTNLSDIKPVDVGNDIDVFWADRDLEINGETELAIDQVKGFEKDGWRLPTIKEADDLLTDAKWVSDKGRSKGWCKFYKIGITHMSKVNPKTTVYFECKIPEYTRYWEAEAKSCPDDHWSIFSFKQEGYQKNLFPHSAYGMCKITDKCRVRLVKSKSKNIKESVWGDLHSRGIGELVREEDDVNLLDDTAFTEYLKDTYTVNDPITSLEIYIDGAGEITLPVFEYDMGTRSVEFMYYTPKEKKVLIGDLCHWDDKLMDKIKKTYKTSEITVMYSKYIQISPKKGEINNSFFLEVLDFILENANRFYHRLLVKNIKESVWGDLHSRGIGELVREEDDVDLMDMDSFAEYLNERYKTKNGNKIRGESWEQTIIIPFYKKTLGMIYILEYCYKNKKDKYLSIGRDFQYTCPDIYNALIRQFDFQDFNTKNMQWAEKINPKDGSEVTNNFVVEVLDFITSLPIEDNKLLIEKA